MARQVFFNPFGNYVNGFDTGTQRQIGLEGAVRQARNSDYNFNVLQPMRTDILRRQDQLDAAAQPYKLKMPAIEYNNAVYGMRNNEYNLDSLGSRLFNVPSPLEQFGRDAFGLSFGTYQTPNGPNTTIFAHGTDGKLYPVGQHTNYGQYLLNNNDFTRQLQLQQLRNQALLYGARGGAMQIEAQARQEAAAAAMWRAQHGLTAYPQYSGGSLTGFDTVPGIGSPLNFDPNGGF